MPVTVKWIGISHLIVAGRLLKTRIRSARLMASDKSWVTKMAVFFAERMMLQISEETDSLV